MDNVEIEGRVETLGIPRTTNLSHFGQCRN